MAVAPMSLLSVLRSEELGEEQESGRVSSPERKHVP